jgi:parallel beta helix pectate lyase-like protein/uncharacterized protein DUF1565
VSGGRRRGARAATWAAACLGLCAVSAMSCGTARRADSTPEPAAPATAAAPNAPATSAERPSRTVRNYYVSRSGSDAQNGSRKRPWRTLAHAAKHAGPGSTVHVATGRYPGPLVLSRNGRPGRRIRFVAEQRWGARIAATSSGSLGIVEISGDYVDFDGFDISGRGGDGTAGIVIPGSHVRVLRNRVHDVLVACDGGSNGGGGIVAGGGLPDYRNHDIEVVGNLVHDVVGTPTRRCEGVQGIYASVARVLIANNVVYRNAHDCITSWHAATQLTIVNNTAINCPGAGITIGSGGPGATSSGNVHTFVANNLVYGNGQGIVETSDGAHRVGPGNRFLNNLVYRSGNGAPSRGAIVSGTVSSNPKLASAADSYRLTAGSAAIDAGTSNGAPHTDFDRVHRPQGPRVDIGAFEWRAPASSSP